MILCCAFHLTLVPAVQTVVGVTVNFTGTLFALVRFTVTPTIEATNHTTVVFM